MAEKKVKGFKIDAKLLAEFERVLELAGSSDGVVLEALALYWIEATPDQRMEMTSRLAQWRAGNPPHDDEPSAGKIAPASNYGKPGNRMAARKPHDRGTTG
jgi:hypothetical protein